MRRIGVLLVLLLGSAVLSRPADAAFPGSNGSIAYQSPGGSNAPTTDTEIWVESQFGGTAPITDNGVQDFSPAYSPDGTKIAFAERQPDGTDEIFVMDASGNNPVRLTKNTADEGEPAWSPNGKKLVFTRQIGLRGGDLFVMDARDRNNDGRGDNLVRLTTHKGDHGFSGPAWSPNGKWIAFSRYIGNANYEIYKMHAASLSSSNRPKRLTRDVAPNLFTDGDPDWSPDGTKIVFSTTRFGHFDIGLMNSDGTSIAPVTNDSTTDGTPVFSPDGTRIAFYRSVTGGGDIYTVDPAGTNLNDETNTTTLSETDPSWQPQP